MKIRKLASVLKQGLDISDEEFDQIYPLSVRQKSKTHWSPVKVAKTAARLLVDKPGINVLDAGSGAGKFCLIGAASTKGIFTGVEQRKHLADMSNNLFNEFGLTNANVVHANILSIDFKKYDAFYFYNPFMENICKRKRIDDTVCLSKDHYQTYIRYVHKQLKELPNGTKVVTYCSNKLKIPKCYNRRASFKKGLLELWVKSNPEDAI